MSTKKRKWSEWAYDFVRKSGKCPGEAPAFGLPDAQVTEEEFLSSVSVAEPHAWHNCHFRSDQDGVDPIDSPPPGMKKLVVKYDPKVSDVNSMVGHLEEVMDSQRLVTLKKNLHAFIERIQLKDGGTLVVPAPLLDISKYIGKFFDVK